MSPVRKDAPLTALEKLEEALVESILGMSETELRDELQDAGEDPDSMIRDFDAMLVALKNACSLERLREAQQKVIAFQEGLVAISDVERKAAHEALEANRSAKNGQFLLAARKGKGSSKHDEEGLVDDYAELKRLEAEEEATSDNDAG